MSDTTDNRGEKVRSLRDTIRQVRTAEAERSTAPNPRERTGEQSDEARFPGAAEDRGGRGQRGWRDKQG